jgi:transposase
MTTDKKRIRRNHSPALKAQILAQCAAPGASVAKVAMAHGINANIVHGWRKLARDGGQPALAAPAFVPVRIEPPAQPPATSVPAATQRSGDPHRCAVAVCAAAGHARWRRSAAGGGGQHAGAAQAHHGYLFANARGTRLKLLVHDGFGVWCAARRLHTGRFAWVNASSAQAPALQLTPAQFDALVIGLPWQRLPELEVLSRA